MVHLFFVQGEKTFDVKSTKNHTFNAVVADDCDVCVRFC